MQFNLLNGFNVKLHAERQLNVALRATHLIMLHAVLMPHGFFKPTIRSSLHCNLLFSFFTTTLARLFDFVCCGTCQARAATKQPCKQQNHELFSRITSYKNNETYHISAPQYPAPVEWLSLARASVTINTETHYQLLLCATLRGIIVLVDIRTC